MRSPGLNSHFRLARCVPGLTMLLRAKGWLAVTGFIVILLIVFVGHVSRGDGTTSAQWVQNLKRPHVNNCPDNLNWLSSLNIAYPVQYARRDILIMPDANVERKSVTKVNEVLFPDFQTIDLSKDSTVQLKSCKEPLRLAVPDFPVEAVDASHIVFGISTTLERLEKTIPSLVRWLPHTQARLLVIVIESEQVDDVKAVAADPGKKKELETRMRSMGMDITLVDPPELQDSFSEKYFSLVKVMWSHRNEKTAWIATIDDDTFFPSMSSLVTMLAKYNPDEKYYVGALSENWWSVTRYGMMAFGGAGIFLSRAMGEVLDENYQMCKETSHTTAGDIRILECVYATTTSKLTNERDLHQIDLWEDLSGLFESGKMPLSLHHWKPGAAYAKGYDVPTMHIVADVCRDCFLQRWWFKKDLMLTNGYSISLYPQGDLPKANLNYMEETWAKTTEVEFSVNHGTDHSMGPTRPRLELDKQKVQYKLIASAAVDGGVRQAYWHQGVNGDMDAVLELFWVQDLSGLT